jgi:adenylylsulfate kinase-like enzyme
MSVQGFTVWVTGPDARAVDDVVASVVGGLAGRQLAVETVDARTPGLRGLDAATAATAVVLAAGLLTRHGVVSVVALPGTRASRDQARAELGRMIEVYVPGEGAGYEAPDRPEVEVTPKEAGAGVERVLRTLEVLQLLPRDEDRYSEEEEREVIKRLKAFGYL